LCRRLSWLAANGLRHSARLREPRGGLRGDALLELGRALGSAAGPLTQALDLARL
jgi:hypothetical protein